MDMDGVLSSLLVNLPYAALGLVVGLVYFRALAHAVRATLSGGPTGRAVAWHAGRLIGGVALFWAVSTQGAAALLLTFAGFLAARMIAAKTDGGRAAP